MVQELWPVSTEYPINLLPGFKQDMLTTRTRDPLEVIVDASSSEVIIGPGTVQFGTTIARFDGTRVPYANMTSLAGLPGNYQLSVLSMSYYFGAVDMTSYDSTMSSSLGSLAYPNPAVPSSDSRAVGAFTFYNSDGTVQVTSFSKVV